MSGANASPTGRSHQTMSGANASPTGRSRQSMSGANASPTGRSHQSMSGANASPTGRSHQSMSGANASPTGRSHQSMATRLAMPRRTFLRGMGIAIGLPLLDAMVPAFSAMANTAAKPVRRLGFIYIPMGANMALWTPKGEGALGELSPILDALAPYRQRLTLLTNLELKHANAPTNGNHALSNAAFLSCAKAKMTEGNDYFLGTTVDQIAAKHLGADTPLRSLELGTDLAAQVGNCDNGFACAYQNNLSWISPTTPLPPEADPRVVFERMFGDGGSAAERRAESRKNQSILDAATEDIARLRREVGPSDRLAADQYFESVRELERRIQKSEQQSADSGLTDLERPVSVPASWEEHTKLMFDLQVLALQADVTRVITFQLAREASTRTYPQIGVVEAHHPVSHHRHDPEKLAKLAKINAYHMSLFAYFLERLQSTSDGDGSLLDHVMYMLGSGMGNPDAHDHVNLPALVAGGGAGALKGGRHIRYAERTPMANLHLTLLDKMGVRLESFGDSSGKLKEMEPLNL
jgi:hypothetical protein